MQLRDLIVNPFAVWRREIVILAAVSLSLAVLQYLFLTSGISTAGALQNIYLSSYVNEAWDHFYTNILMIWLALVYIFMLTPAAHKRQFWLNVFLILVFSPLVLYSINTLVITIPTGIPTLGSSGIASVFLGYCFYSLSKFLVTAWNNNLFRHRFKEYQVYMAAQGLFLVPLFIILFLADFNEPALILTYGIAGGILQTMYLVKINIFLHIAGYVLGLCIPVVSEKIVPL